MIKDWKKFNEQKVDTSFVISKITDKFSKDEVSKILKSEKLAWSDDEESYSNSNNGEAEDVALDFIIDYFENEFYSLGDEKDKVVNLIKKEYNI